MEESMRSSVRPWLAATLCLAFGAAAAYAQGDEAEMIFNNAIGHLREGRPAQALEEMRRAVKKDPKNAYFQKGLGLAHLALNQPNEAIVAFRRALELNPNYADVRNDLGTALLVAGKREEGRSELLRAYNEPLNPRPDMTARNLAETYFEEKDYAKALSWFETSAQKNRRLAEGYIGMGKTLVALGRGDEAITRLEEGLSATSESSDVLLALGETLYRAGRFSDARAPLERVTKKDAESRAGQRAAELLKNLPR
jgi:Tfp pilus assembly protein PilF